MIMVKNITTNLETILKTILRILLILMVLVTFLQVIMRYVFDAPLTWAEETIGVLMIYFGLIGGSFGVFYGIHIALELFVDRLLKKWERGIRYLELLIYIFFGIIEIIYGIQIMKLTVFQVLPATGVPVPYTYLALPISGLIMVFFAIVLFTKVRKGEKNESGTNYIIR